MKIVEKKLVGDTAGETKAARRATGVFPAGALAAETPARVPLRRPAPLASPRRSGKTGA